MDSISDLQVSEGGSRNCHISWLPFISSPREVFLLVVASLCSRYSLPSCFGEVSDTHETWILWTVPNAAKESSRWDRILRSCRRCCLTCICSVRGKLVVENILHTNSVVGVRHCPGAEGEKKDLRTDGILFTWHCRKLCRNDHFWEKGILIEWVFEKGQYYIQTISYGRSFPLSWTFFFCIFHDTVLSQFTSYFSIHLRFL